MSNSSSSSSSSPRGRHVKAKAPSLPKRSASQVRLVFTRLFALLITAPTHALRTKANFLVDGVVKRSSLTSTRVATGLALVLATFTTTTGASAVTSSPVSGPATSQSSAPIVLDPSAQSEAIAAKVVVSQYLEVRKSFANLKASRSRAIAVLESDIVQAQAKADEVALDGNKVINIASKYAGSPYLRGGTTPKGFDCSGFTSFVFKKVGVKLPRVSGAQAAWADKVAKSDREVGDLMFWANRGGVHHVAIYAGDGKMWDSPRPGRSVGKVSIWGNPTYGRVPAAVLNRSVITQIADKTFELEALKADVPTLEISISQ